MSTRTRTWSNSKAPYLLPGARDPGETDAVDEAGSRAAPCLDSGIGASGGEQGDQVNATGGKLPPQGVCLLLRVNGVAGADIFNLDSSQTGAFTDSLTVGPSQIIQVHNDSDAMQSGSIEFQLQGGRR